MMIMEKDIQTEQSVTTSTVIPEQEVVKTTKTVAPPAAKQGEHPQKVYQQKHKIFRAYQIIWYLLAVIEILLAFRMALKALGANPNSGFAVLIYGLSAPFARPFVDLFNISVTQHGSIFEWSTIIAAAVYALVAYGIIHLIQMVKPVTKEEVEATVDEV